MKMTIVIVLLLLIVIVFFFSSLLLPSFSVEVDGIRVYHQVINRIVKSKLLIHKYESMMLKKKKKLSFWVVHQEIDVMR